ncbi:MAG: hypothetical protein K6G10_12020 [Butyrivibrio sp.]|nr:hypothetical protein [Butyrivibrio sp.]
MKLQKIAITALLILIIAISITKVAPWAADPTNHAHSIEQTDDKIATVMALSGGAAATSAAISLLPGDVCTPISEELAELAKYFLVILSALYLEKFLITISGYITFSVLIPAALLLLSIAILFGKKNLGSIAGKIAVVGLAIFIIVPASVWLSDKVYQTQADRVNSTIEQYNDMEDDGDTGFFDQITTVTTNTVDKATNFLSSLLEALAVMIVTACVIPILVFVFLIWLIKTIFAGNTLTLDTGSLLSLKDKLVNNSN